MSKKEKIDKAFILAAGFGTRLRPYTNKIPKPMVSIAGKPIIHHIIDKLKKSGITEITVNTHYKNKIIEDFLSNIDSPRIRTSYEPDILDTGLGIKKALDNFDNKPFIIINGDAFWEDKSESTITKLINKYDTNSDLLLLLQDIDKITTSKAVGDYDIINTKPHLNPNKTGSYMFTGIRIAHPRLFNNTPDTPFSFLELMKKAEQENKLSALINPNIWHHISTPEDLIKINEVYNG